VVVSVRTLVSDSVEIESAEPVATYTAIEGTVGRSLQLSARTEWSPRLELRNRAAGVVTRIADEATLSELDVGDEILAIDERPVFVAVGEVPRFRDLSVNMAGQDVAALQAFLSSQGFEVEVDGVFGSTTRSVVRSWQKLLGQKDDGVVRVGDVLFLPALPVRFALDPQLSVGDPIADQATIGTVYEADPQFVVQVQAEQAQLLPTGTRALITVGDSSVGAQVGGMSTDAETGLQTVTLDYSAPCGDPCSVLTGGVTTLHPVVFTLIAETTGVTVPVAFISTTADGTTVVTGRAGATRPVEIVAASNGVAVVTGIEAGDVLLHPAQRSAG
jgi:peptidoglycan hydrolase-like protein with peptidoglycan-binding domain